MGVLRHNADGGIIISASHNPAQWNALKLLNGTSEFMTAAEGKEMIAISDSGEFNYKMYDEIGSISEDNDLLEYHIEEILKLDYIDPEIIRSAKLSVAVDAVNGAGSVGVPLLLENLELKRFIQFIALQTDYFHITQNHYLSI